MLARINPQPLSGTVPAIASKSMAHRIIIAAALANGVTRIACDSTCADIDATIRCLTALGARIQWVSGGLEVHPAPKSIEHGLLRALAGATLDCGESGSTLRFMLPVACALGADATFVGSGRLGERPLSPLAEELIAAGSELEGLGGLPLRTKGRMRAGRFELPGNVSSQYVSGLLLAAPLLAGTTEVAVTGELESRPYVDLTIDVLGRFGVEVTVEEGATAAGLPLTVFTVSSQGYRTPREIAVEGDWSNAAFWLCAGALGRHSVTVRGVSANSIQGDRNVGAALMLFGAKGQRNARAATIRPDRLRGITLDAHDIPDLVPVLAAVASCAEGTTRFTGCSRLRIKESDRLATTAAELTNLGARVRVEGDGLVIEGSPMLAGGRVNSHNDHRIAMMAAVAAVRCEGMVEIAGAEAVNKSYPDFFEHYRMLGGDVELIDE
ncbi:MAG: 3-phosphoshikimate 1-carboxyvinyltransferase [Coriobacteriaceae bacterium]|nr:3-phosphoshikimate 1-carboxyvinyltransferase [Coriobacteriaceae bacterium]